MFHLRVHFSCNPAKVLTHCHIKVFARLTSIKFGREWGYFYLLSGTETGISFDGIRVLVLYKRFVSHVSPSVARLPLLVRNIASAIIVINLFFFSIVIIFTQIVFSLAG